MNQLLDWLSGGDARSDGEANQVAALVLQNPVAFEDLYACLSAADEVVRGRAADALEKVARLRPDLLRERLPELERLLKRDPAIPVRFHLAMLLGHLAGDEALVGRLTASLLAALDDDSPFVRSWAIASLACIGRLYPAHNSTITGAIAARQRDPSAAVRTRVRKALAALTNPGVPFPAGWVKSERLRHKVYG